MTEQERLRRIQDTLADYRIAKPGTSGSDRATLVGRIFGIVWDTPLDEERAVRERRRQHEEADKA